MQLTIGQDELLQQFVLAHTRIGDGLTEIARQMSRANDIAERRLCGDETNLGVVSEAVQSVSTALEAGLDNLTDAITAYVGEVVVGLFEQADNDFTEQTVAYRGDECSGPGPDDRSYYPADFSEGLCDDSRQTGATTLTDGGPDPSPEQAELEAWAQEQSDEILNRYQGEKI